MYISFISLADMFVKHFHSKNENHYNYSLYCIIIYLLFTKTAWILYNLQLSNFCRKQNDRLCEHYDITHLRCARVLFPLPLDYPLNDLYNGW